MKTSFRRVRKDALLVACERYIDTHSAKLRQIQEMLIKRAMQPKWFGLIKGKTREEVIESLGQNIWNKYKYTALQLHGGLHNLRVLELRSLCLIPGEDSVQLSAEDADILVSFFDKETEPQSAALKDQ